MTSRSIYLIVFDLTNKDQSRVSFWLNSVVNQVGQNSAIILVGTHLDAESLNGVDRASILEKGKTIGFIHFGSKYP